MLCRFVFHSIQLDRTCYRPWMYSQLCGPVVCFVGCFFFFNVASVYLIQGLVKLYNGLVLFKIRLCVLHAVGCQVGFICVRVRVRFRSGDQSSSVGGYTRESAPSSHLLSWRKEAAAAWTSLALVNPPWPPREPGILLCHYRFRSPAPLGQRKQDEVVRCRPEVRVNRRSYPPTGLLFVESLSLPCSQQEVRYPMCVQPSLVVCPAVGGSSVHVQQCWLSVAGETVVAVVEKQTKDR